MICQAFNILLLVICIFDFGIVQPSKHFLVEVDDAPEEGSDYALEREKKDCKANKKWMEGCRSCSCQPDGKEVICSSLSKRECAKIKRQNMEIADPESGFWMPTDKSCPCLKKLKKKIDRGTRRKHKCMRSCWKKAREEYQKAKQKEKEECGDRCPLLLQPVCGSDGKTYSNKCLFNIASCKSDGEITVAHYGWCKKEEERDELCSQPSGVTGPCKAGFKRWTFVEKRGLCLEFTYGGCGGNDNNFENREDCQRTCKPSGGNGSSEFVCEFSSDCRFHPLFHGKLLDAPVECIHGKCEMGTDALGTMCKKYTECDCRFDGKKDVVLHLPPGTTVDQLKWISVWCRQFNINFGHVMIK